MDPHASAVPAAAGSVAHYDAYGAPPMPPGVDAPYGGGERGGHGFAERGGRQLQHARRTALQARRVTWMCGLLELCLMRFV